MEHKRYQELLTGWSPQKVLPSRIGDFVLREPTATERAEGVFFAYEDKRKNWHIYGMYSAETDDYLVRYDLGLMEMVEVRLLTGDMELFRTLLAKNFEKIVTERWVNRAANASVIVRKTGLLTRDMSGVLPARIGAYQLKIEPHEPLAALNGSYIVAAYATAENDRGVLFFYNTFRNDFFAETRKDQVPGMIHDFDAKNLQDFSDRIGENLTRVLHELDV